MLPPRVSLSPELSDTGVPIPGERRNGGRVYGRVC
jgi:hypothetical protein